MIERWKRKEKHITYSWGLPIKKMVEDRAERNRDFRGYWKYSTSAEGPSLHIAGKSLTNWIKLLNIVISAVLFSCSIGIYYVFKLFVPAGLFNGIGLGIITAIVNAVYKVLAKKFVFWENYKFIKQKEASFMMKIFVFEFINTNIALIYSLTRGKEEFREDNPDSTEEELSDIYHSAIFSLVLGMSLGRLGATLGGTYIMNWIKF